VPVSSVREPVQKLSPTSTTSERVEGLTVILDVPLVAKTAGVSATAVRKWMKGTEPRAEMAMTIDDLRSVVVVLVDAGFEPERIRTWLFTRNRDWLDNERPIECLSRQPVMVLSAANDAAMVHRFGPSSAAKAADG
jgi:plastocyanin domain-containing protein